MIRTLLFSATCAVTLAGCALEPDDFVSDEVEEARQNMRLRSYQHLDCAELEQHRLIASPARGPQIIFAPQLAMLGRQTLSDIEEAMRRKGCPLPAGT